MPILPDISSAATWGATAWADAEPIVDPTTEASATVFREIAADAAASTHTQIRAIVSFACATYTSGNQPITVRDSDAVWGNLAPIIPTVVQTSAGVYLVTWPSTQHDELGGSHTLNIRFVHQPTIVGLISGHARIGEFTSNSITVQTFDTAWAANSLNGNWINLAWT